MKQLLLFILSFLNISFIFSQAHIDDRLKTGTIKGMVHDASTQNAIEYATVGLYRAADSTLVNGVITATDGSFVFSEVQPGLYYLVADFLGYSKRILSPVNLNTNNAGLDLGNLALKPSVTEIEEVQVVAQSNRVEYKIDKKVVNVAQDISSAGGTLVNVLENTPSVEVDVEGNVTLRGSGNFQLLIDGKPSVIQGSEGLQQIPASAVQSLEIITSPSAKYDPDGDAGIINVIMRKQKNPGFGGVINASIGSRGKYTSDFLLNFKRDKLNYFIGGEFADQKFFNEGKNERRTYTGDTNIYIFANNEGLFRRNSLNLKSGFDYALTENSSLSFSGVIGKRDFARDFTSNSSWLTIPASKDSFYREDSHGNEEDNFYNLNLDYQKKYAGNGHNLQASIYYAASKEVEKEEDLIRKTDSQFRQTGNAPTRTRSGTETPEKEIRLELDYTRPVGSTKIETGIQSRWDADESDYIYEDYHPLDAEWLLNDTISNSILYRDALQSAYFIFSTPVGKFEFQAGLRTEYDHRKLDQQTTSETFVYEKFHFFPSFYVIRKLSDKHQLQFTYSRRIQRPRERDLNPFREFRGANNVFYGNPSLKPEFTNSFEFNYQYTFQKGFVSLETYYRATYDKITQVNGYDTIAGRPVFTFTSANANEDNSLGMELMANLDITPWWQLNLTGNIFRYKLQGIIDNEEISAASNSWRTNLNTSFKLKWDSRLQLTAIYNGPSNTLQGQRDGFFISNVAVRKEMLKKQLTVSLNIRDVFATGRFSFTSEGRDFYTYNVGKREAPVVTLNLTYRLNNYRQTANRRDNNGGNSEINGIEEIM